MPEKVYFEMGWVLKISVFEDFDNFMRKFSVDSVSSSPERNAFELAALHNHRQGDRRNLVKREVLCLYLDFFRKGKSECEL